MKGFKIITIPYNESDQWKEWKTRHKMMSKLLHIMEHTKKKRVYRKNYERLNKMMGE